MILNQGISIIGCGNVAWHLAEAFRNSGTKINCIVSRNPDKAKELATHIGTIYSNKLDSIPQNTSLALICISDDAIEEVAKGINPEIPVAHTSASIPLSALGSDNKSTGVFYPFQTFTKNVRQGSANFPVFIESESPEMLAVLEKLGNKVSDTVVKMTSEKRKYLHIAGIIVNNFTNYLYGRANDILIEKGINPEYLLPIIHETTAKLEFDHPDKLQTGPARRKNYNVIQSHLELLKGEVEAEELYKFLSTLILNHFNENK